MIELDNIINRPFGKGDYPTHLLDFFNWGAFAFPEIWAILHGCWAILWAAVAAQLIPLYVLLQMNESSVSPSLYFGFLAFAQLCLGAVRLWAGMKANQFYWKQVAAGRGGFGLAPKELTIRQFFSRQRQWAIVGMIVLLVVNLSGGMWNYSIIQTTGGQSDALFSAGQDIVWVLAFLLGAYYIALQGTILMAPQRGFAYLTNDSVVSIDGEIFSEKQAIDSLNVTALEEAKQQRDANVTVNESSSEPGPDADNDIYAYPLANGQILPVLGLGTYKMEPGSETILSVKYALEAEYRSFDTATLYGNEQSIAQAIKQYGISRDDIFLTSKVWNTNQGYVNTIHALEESLAQLGTDYLDMYLIHWPIEKTLRSTWRALEHLYQAGKVRTIGVCNFEIDHLERLLSHAEIAPMINQIELHPRFTREELVLYCWNHGMLVQSWAPLIRGGVTLIPELSRIAAAHGKTEAQVALRWAVQHNFAVIPKSTSRERIFENTDIFDFELTSEEMSLIDSLNRNTRVGPDPEEYSWHSK